MAEAKNSAADIDLLCWMDFPGYSQGTRTVTKGTLRLFTSKTFVPRLLQIYIHESVLFRAFIGFHI